jgi:hypothetical protein
MVEKGYMFLSIHYEKSCFSKPHCLATKAPKQVIYNYIATKTWKTWVINKIKFYVKKSRSCTIV